MVVESGGYVEADVVVGLVCCFLNFKLVQTGFDRIHNRYASQSRNCFINCSKRSWAYNPGQPNLNPQRSKPTRTYNSTSFKRHA